MIPGMLTYLSQFIPQLAYKIHTLRGPVKESVPWTWGTDQQTSFEALKDVIYGDACLKYYGRRAFGRTRSRCFLERAESGASTERQTSGIWIEDTIRVSIKIQQHRARNACSGVWNREVPDLPVRQTIHHNH